MENNMDYYLYSHSNADGIFYIGKGCGGRKDRYDRGEDWQIRADKGFTTKVEANGTHKDILALEKIVIKSLFSQGVNLVNKMHNPNWSRDNALAELENGNIRFLLQNYYNKAWAENFKMYIDIVDAQACYEAVKEAIDQNAFGKAKINAPKDEGYAMVTYAWDPSGVLLHFAQAKAENS